MFNGPLAWKKYHKDGLAKALLEDDMSYYPDFSDYKYNKAKPKENILNIGWLDAGHAFNTGKADDYILERLLSLCRASVNRTRGYHLCPLCKHPSFGLSVESQNGKVVLGSSEIWVKGENSRIYAAPDLIYHYILDHDYLPPAQFLTAVEKGDIVIPNRDRE